jgi:hypothetical protein
MVYLRSRLSVLAVAPVEIDSKVSFSSEFVALFSTAYYFASTDF